VRSCIDGKSRTVVYLSASADNRADTNLQSFVSAVRMYGVPLRTRSDKGGENVQIAKYMIESRGTGRASHICGRSVHNQRYIANSATRRFSARKTLIKLQIFQD
jgi:hypothetical protein